jgi:hypothetical protein
MRRWMRQSVLPILAVTLSACATMMNPGKIQTIPNPPTGWSGKVMSISLYRMPRTAQLFVNGRGIDLSKVRVGPESYFGEGYDAEIWVPQDKPVTLRVVDGARSGTAQIETKFYARWIWFNGFLGPAFPVGLIVDAKTDKWRYVRDNVLDVPQLLTAGNVRLRR